tara:strand:+ start:711 stop:890 length:180 start_codon:yes stop_codon:yes gene_type:complete
MTISPEDLTALFLDGLAVAATEGKARPLAPSERLISSNDLDRNTHIEAQASQELDHINA